MTTVMTSDFKSVARLPIRLTLLYVCVTFFVFVAGPFDWPVDNWATLFGFLGAAMAALWIGFRFAIARPVKAASFDPWKQTIILGACFSVVVLLVSTPTYTGKMPWEVLSALSDQGAAYEAMQGQLELTAGSRGLIAVARVLTWPLVFAVIPLGILHWGRIGLALRGLVATTLGSIIVSSILRGTDRESADLLAIVGSAGSILAARSIVHERVGLRTLLYRFRIAILVGVVLLGSAAALFIERKDQRSVTASILCVGQSEPDPAGICADFDYPVFARLGLPDPVRFVISMAAAYLGQGYYGLSKALDLPDFRSTLGLGNAPFAMAAYTALTGDVALYQDSYTYRLRDVGWSDETQWSTIFPWLANDVSFPGVPVLMLLIGWWFGASWRDAVFGRDDRAAIVFAIFAIMMGYLPANNQIALAPDYLFALLVWSAMWRLKRTPDRGPGAAASDGRA